MTTCLPSKARQTRVWLRIEVPPNRIICAQCSASRRCVAVLILPVWIPATIDSLDHCHKCHTLLRRRRAGGGAAVN